jgi:hypothetical protein
MDSDYVFLCGVICCRFGQQEAGKELLRAATTMDPEMDPDMRALAWAMLAQGARRLRNWEDGPTPLLARSLEETYVDEIMRGL